MLLDRRVELRMNQHHFPSVLRRLLEPPCLVMDVAVEVDPTLIVRSVWQLARTQRTEFVHVLGVTGAGGVGEVPEGAPVSLSPGPISQSQMDTSSRSGASYQFLMMTPAQSAKDSLSAPDWVAYTSCDVVSITPWVNSWPMTLQ